MGASSTSPLSIERLQSQVNELEAKLAHSNELISKVREHKHNYSEDFGLVVSAPVKSLLKELINNPSIFSVEERERILDMFSESMEMRGIYECLGWPVEIQLSKVKNEMVPCIKNNVEFYTSLIGKNAEFQDRWLVSKLKMALNEADGLCAKLANIEHFEYGESEPFNLKAEIKDTFIKDNSAIGFRGGQPMQLEWFFGEYPDIMVDMNRKSFRTHLLGNIIKNLHDHAFNEPNIESSSKSLSHKSSLSFWGWLLNIFNIRNNGASGHDYADSLPVSVQEKKVKISFHKDLTNEHRINLIIENNGNVFNGDVNEVFEKGIGEGEGEHIGLYSAKQFLNAYGASISMFTNNDAEYKVGFLINLPVL